MMPGCGREQASGADASASAGKQARERPSLLTRRAGRERHARRAVACLSLPRAPALCRAGFPASARLAAYGTWLPSLSLSSTSLQLPFFFLLFASRSLARLPPSPASAPRARPRHIAPQCRSQTSMPPSSRPCSSRRTTMRWRWSRCVGEQGNA
jgi:hypothetical protein